MKVKLIAVLAVISVLLVAFALQRQGDDRVDDLQSRQLLSEEQLAIANQLDSLTTGAGAWSARNCSRLNLSVLPRCCTQCAAPA